MRSINQHVWNPIPEDDQMFRNTILEQSKVVLREFGGLKFQLPLNLNSRWETYSYQVWQQMATMHPTLGMAIQGTNTIDIRKIAGVTLKGEYGVAIPHYRFVGAHQIKTNGLTPVAATYVGKGRIEHAVFMQRRMGEDAIFAAGNPTVTAATDELLIDILDPRLRYTNDMVYLTVANGTPIEQFVPMNANDQDRYVPVWDATVNNNAGAFVAQKWGGAVTPTDISTRLIEPTTEVIGVTTQHIPVNQSFQDVLDHTQSPMADVTLMNLNVTPVFHSLIPYIAGGTGAATSQLIAAGDILPGGIIHNALCVKRTSWPFIPFPFEQGKEKLPALNEYVGPGPLGEFQPSATSYVPMPLINGTYDYTSAAGTVTATGANFYKTLTVADLPEPQAIITNTKTGQCYVGALTAANATTLTVTGAPAFGTDVSVTLALQKKLILGRIDRTLPAMRNFLNATRSTASNVTQGFTDEVYHFSRIIFEAFVDAERVYTDPVTTTVYDFKKGTAVTGGKTAPLTYKELGDLMVKEMLIGFAVVRVDVFKQQFVSK